MFKDFENWLVEVDENGFAILTINRESFKNSIDSATIGELGEILDVVASEESIKAIIITGAGRIFGIGAHIPEIMKSNDPEKSKEMSSKGQKIFSRLETIGKPSCAAINGIFCLGGSFELALCCTFRVASKRVRVGLPEVTLGVLPGYGGSQRLPKYVGISKAREIILTGQPIKAEEAYNLGIVSTLTEAGDEIAQAKVLLKKVLANGPVAIKHAMQAIDKSFELSLVDGLALESTLFSELRQTKDADEGLLANQEKRKANFKGL